MQEVAAVLPVSRARALFARGGVTLSTRFVSSHGVRHVRARACFVVFVTCVLPWVSKILMRAHVGERFVALSATL